MATKKKLLQAAAGAAGGAGLDVDEVFSTFLYTGDNNTRTITNSIDFSGEGGLLWIQNRSQGGNHHLFDTARGSTKNLHSNRTDADATSTTILTSFNSDGYSIGTGGNSTINNAGDDFVAWSWRKAPKWFDVLTYTGTGSQQSIAHNLGSTPGMIIVKAASFSEGWRVWHRELDATSPSDYIIGLNSSSQRTADNTNWGDPSSTHFVVKTSSGVNASGQTYVAYLFAHNDGDGEFGPDSDQDIIKCGSYTGNGSSTGPEIDLGFEPQWLLVKNANNSSSDWLLLDVMRGWGMGDADIFLEPNTSGADQGSQNWVDITPTGFKITNSNGQINGSGNTLIYMAIRRGPLAEPESATDVFAMDTGTNPGIPTFTSGFPVDMGIFTATTGDSNYIKSRLTGDKYLLTNSTNSEATDTAFFDNMDGWENNLPSSYLSWMWKRAPEYFDVVAYTGNGVQGHNITHNLGVAPDMMWVKQRDTSFIDGDWKVYVRGITHLSVYGSDPDNYGDNPVSLVLNGTNAAQFSSSGVWDHTHPTDTYFRLGDTYHTNRSGDPYIAYLFATVAGVSKVGSYTGNGTSQTIDCGFSAGARFVITKRTNDVGSWTVFDTERGIVAGNDSYLRLNSTSAEDTDEDSIDPDNSGFIVNHGTSANCNRSDASYIFYAIA